MSALRIKNTSESDPRSYEATKAVAKKAQKKFWDFNGIRTHDLRDTCAMLYQLSYEASPEARVQFIPIIWRDTVVKVKVILAFMKQPKQSNNTHYFPYYT